MSIETLFFEALKTVYPDTIRNYRPDWLLNLSTGKNLELDCYNYKEKKAWEVNGAHHFSLYQETKDKKKAKICEQRGIKLYSFFEVKHMINYLKKIGADKSTIKRIRRWNTKQKRKKHYHQKQYHKNRPDDKRYRKAIELQKQEQQSILQRKQQGSTMLDQSF